MIENLRRTTPFPNGPAAPGINEALTWWLRGWPAVCHLVLDIVVALPYLLLTVFLLVAVVLVPVFGIGLPVLAAVLLGAIGLARLDLLRLEAMTGARLEWMAAAPGRTGRHGLRRWLLDVRPWRSMAWVAVQSVWGLVSGTLALTLASVTLALVFAPLYVWWLPSHEMYWPWGGTTSGPWWLLLVFTVGVTGMVITPLIATGLITLDLMLARLLLTRNASAERLQQLNLRVQTLTRTRAATVDSVEAERQRIERDLHDGPQQRLVAIAMDLGLARDRLDRDPDGARDLMDKAHSAAKEAVVEMRQVARGIHPPILTDRGLDAALSALAGSSPVPVTVRTDLPRRPDPTVEAIAYFCVSEGLTNVAKHAHAQQARVLVSAAGEWLRIEIEDDGVGGAQPGTGGRGGGGTGLRGLADRVAAIDGAVHLSSPAGGPTVLTIHLPFHPSVTETGSSS
ncbi:sensor domain-containing protein [Kineosporia sp. J2-2]|uniref:histidine kinase n=1 Tax=Kineosporia corallincola TaxID=2835133 RepID=A0ABS5TLV6_9ACTN|nr:sensor histidine kinase [Kineosporia corallincola]MBT0772082.1 sensor domain-containing protein [Kineosporia corallincola]